MARTIILYKDLRAKGITLGKCQLWRLERADQFPKRVALSAARHGWYEDEIDAHIASRPRRQLKPVAAEAVAA